MRLRKCAQRVPAGLVPEAEPTQPCRLTAVFTAQCQAGGFNVAAEHFGLTSSDSADDLGLAVSVAAELHTGFHHRVKVLVAGCRVQCEVSFVCRTYRCVVFQASAKVPVLALLHALTLEQAGIYRRHESTYMRENKTSFNHAHTAMVSTLLLPSCFPHTLEFEATCCQSSTLKLCM